MRRFRNAFAWIAALGFLGACPAPGARAETDAELSQEDRIRQLERQLEVVVDELARVQTEVAVPDEPELKSAYGLGPAASKIYGVSRGLSIGGYGEAFYKNFVGDARDQSDTADFLRLVMYLGYKFTDNIIFNAEIEYEHTEELGVEFAALDFLLADWANARAGLLLIPMGFLNEVHEPPYFFGVNRPEVERRIIPSTWRENGVGIFGTTLGESLSYRAYVVNGFDATGFSDEGLRGGRQNGGRALAEDLALVARADYTPWPELTLGGSLYSGQAGQDQKVNPTASPNAELGVPSTLTTIAEAHVQYRSQGFQARALYTSAWVNDARELTDVLQASGELSATEAISGRMEGYYGEVSYDVWPWLRPGDEKSLEPFLRLEWVDTQADVSDKFATNRNLKEWIYTVGTSFKPHPNVVLKFDYRNRSPREGDQADEINMGIGFVF